MVGKPNSVMSKVNKYIFHLLLQLEAVWGQRTRYMYEYMYRYVYLYLDLRSGVF